MSAHAPVCVCVCFVIRMWTNTMCTTNIYVKFVCNCVWKIHKKLGKNWFLENRMHCWIQRNTTQQRIRNRETLWNLVLFFSASHIIAHLHVRILSRFDIKNNTMVLFNASVFFFAYCWHSGFTIFLSWFIFFSSYISSSSLRTQTFRNYFRIFRIRTCAVCNCAWHVEYNLIFYLCWFTERFELPRTTNRQPPTAGH